jgi:hypothetical protein
VIGPVLRIEVTSTGIEVTDSQYLFTTPEELPSIIRAIPGLDKFVVPLFQPCRLQITKCRPHINY